MAIQFTTLVELRSNVSRLNLKNFTPSMLYHPHEQLIFRSPTRYSNQKLEAHFGKMTIVYLPAERYRTRCIQTSGRGRHLAATPGAARIPPQCWGTFDSGTRRSAIKSGRESHPGGFESFPCK